MVTNLREPSTVFTSIVLNVPNVLMGRSYIKKMPYLANWFFYRFSKKSPSASSKFLQPPSWTVHNGLWAFMMYRGRLLQSLLYSISQILPYQPYITWTHMYSTLLTWNSNLFLLNFKKYGATNEETFLNNQMAFIYKPAKQRSTVQFHSSNLFPF